MVPSSFRTKDKQIANPNPVPFDFVVKYGSKILFISSGGIPFPVSTITLVKEKKGNQN